MKRDSKKYWWTGRLILLTAIVLAGCAWPGPYIRHSWNTAAAFDAYKVYPGYQYYTSGTLNDPRAILALKPGYTLNSKGWQSVAMTPEKMEQWVLALKKDHFVEYNTYADGAQLIDDQGKIAGIYFSVWEFPLIRFSKAKELMIKKPAHDYRLDNDLTEFLSGGPDID